MENINLTPLIQAIIGLLAAIVTYRLIPWIKARTTAAQRENFQAVVRDLVYAAEQVFGSGHGSLKMDYVCDRLREKGFDIDRAAIEAEVYKAFNDAGNIANDPQYSDDTDISETPIDQWALGTLRAFCDDNGVPCEECETREDYIRAIERWGKETNEPPSGAAEGREE